MKSRKQVSLVGTRSQIKRSWTRIISAIHDPQKILGHIPRYDSREGFKASARTPELCACSSAALALDDVGSVDGEVLGPRVPSSRRISLEELDYYSSCNNPIPTSATVRTPRLDSLQTCDLFCFYSYQL
ncbi:hypothetical protein F511_13970 [Dorcoceras hygrometricum]|uniref:Uncharacterized protein n=1 Tax=Dorcoceras hygrometricum TaxID=472368 RepID=A0A2Z7D0R4_9LAMI|nr:hypothetical protein F511_13970 [Dorcoceras hygrometricum]